MSKKVGGYRPIHQKRICAYCEKPFIAKASKTKYCSNPHKANCPICDKEFYHNPIKLLKGVTCSKECQMVKTEKTNLEKYGKKNVLQIKSVREKIKQTSIDRYGVENPGASKKSIEKAQKTNLEKYKTKTPLQNENIKNKIKKTNLEKYGVENPFASDKIKEKIRQTNVKKYGVEYSGSLKHIRNINSERLKNPEIQDKMKQGNIKNIKNKGISNPEDWLNFNEWIRSVNNNEFNIKKLSEYFNLPINKIKNKIRDTNTQNLFNDYYKYSSPELEFYYLLKEIIPENEIISKNRKIIKPFEIDFYLPKYNIAIEINPTWTHKFPKSDFDVGYTDKNYHYNKYKMCESKGIELISLFDWVEKEKIIEFIKRKIKNNYTTVFAKYCEVKISKYNSYHKLFLEENYIFESIIKFSEAQIIELFYLNEMIGIGIFVPTKKQNEYEFKDFCFKKEYKIIGGVSKMLKNFIKINPQITNIIAYSDNNLGMGNVYSKIGFEIAQTVKNNLIWAHDSKKIYINNSFFINKKEVEDPFKNFYDYKKFEIEENLLFNQETIQNYGFVSIYDCGYKKWIYRIKNKKSS